MPAKRTIPQTREILVRLSETLLAELDREARARMLEQKGQRVTRVDVIRTLLADGLVIAKSRRAQ